MTRKELELENEQLKQQIEKMKCCFLCKYSDICKFADCDKKLHCDEWSLKK